MRRRRRQTQDPPDLIERAAARCVEADTGSHVLPTYQVLPVTNGSRRPTSFQTNPLHSTRPTLHSSSGRSQIQPASHTFTTSEIHGSKEKGGHTGHSSFSSHFFFSLFPPSLFISQCHPSIHRSPSRLNDLRRPAHPTHPLVHHSQPPTNGQSPIGDFSVRHCIPALLGNSPCKALRVRGGTSTV